MTDKQTGPLEVRPNILRDQRAPNTFRSQADPGPATRRGLNSGGGNAAPPGRMCPAAAPPLGVGGVVVRAVLVTLSLLTRTP